MKTHAPGICDRQALGSAGFPLIAIRDMAFCWSTTRYLFQVPLHGGTHPSKQFGNTVQMKCISGDKQESEKRATSIPENDSWICFTVLGDSNLMLLLLTPPIPDSGFSFSSWCKAKANIGKKNRLKMNGHKISVLRTDSCSNVWVRPWIWWYGVLFLYLICFIDCRFIPVRHH